MLSRNLMRLLRFSARACRQSGGITVCNCRRYQLCLRSYATGSDTLSSTVTQGVIEKNAPQDPNQPKDLPEPTHPQRNMDVAAIVPNEDTEKFVGDQVPEMPGGGKYPDPSNDERGAEMTSGKAPEATRRQGVRQGSELLSEDVEASTMRKKE